MTALGDGVDADALLATRRADPQRSTPTTSTAVLALFCGYFLERRDQPAPYSSPYLRRHQDWCAGGDLGVAGPAARLELTEPTAIWAARSARW